MRSLESRHNSFIPSNDRTTEKPGRRSRQGEGPRRGTIWNLRPEKFKECSRSGLAEEAAEFANNTGWQFAKNLLGKKVVAGAVDVEEGVRSRDQFQGGFHFRDGFRKDRVCRGRKKLACTASGDGQCEAGQAFEEDAAGKREAANRRRAQDLLKRVWTIAARRRNGRREIQAHVVFLSSL